MTANEDRIGAEKLHAEEVGKTYDFQWDEIEAHEQPADVLADSLLEKFGGQGLPLGLAARIAQWFIGIQKSRPSPEIEDAKRTLSVITSSLLKSNNPRLTAACTRMALGMRVSGHDSMRKVALKEGVTVARVSVLTKMIRKQHELGLNNFNKSAVAAAGYRNTNKRSREKL